MTQQNGSNRLEVHYDGATHSSNAIATVGFVNSSYISRAEHENIINTLLSRISALEADHSNLMNGGNNDNTY